MFETITSIMKKLLYLLLVCSFLSSCDDGDVLEFELDFEDEITLCPDSTNTYLFYNTKDDPFESLILLLPNNTQNNLIFNATNDTTFNRTISGNTRFNYRLYNGDPNGVICNQIIDPNVSVVGDFPAQNGAEAQFSISLTDDDNDGLPFLTENPNELPFEDAPDSDGDGLPDYLDDDDDNDNVPTRQELGEYLQTDNIEDLLNTDKDFSVGADDIPDYLDPDDDGDGVPTISEDFDMDKDPRDDVDFETVKGQMGIFRYLDEESRENNNFTDLRSADYDREVRVKISILRGNIEVLKFDSFEMGIYTYPLTILYTEED